MSFTVTGGGLLVPEGAQEAAVDAALRRHDPNLRLVPQDSDAYGRRIYKVFHYNGPDRAADLVCVWWDRNMEPLPLSMALVDLVQQQDKNTIGGGPTLEETEAKIREERRKDYLRDAEAIVQEFGDKLDGRKTVVLPRSRSLQVSRWRQRRDPSVPEEFKP